MKKMVHICCLLQLLFSLPLAVFSQELRIGTFHVDATPPIGSPVAYAIARSVTEPLSARGVVILSAGKPVVLCAVDWIGISNEGLEVYRNELAKAANTTPDHVSIHALHQHDGVRCDFTIERILSEYGFGGQHFDNAFLHRVIGNTATAVKQAITYSEPFTHIGFGQAKVDSVASNRRILGPDGKVAIIRWSRSLDTAARNAPEGLIDPWLKSVSFWNGDKALAVLTYYTTHPQSYYGEGDVTCEFIGIARDARQAKMDGVPHIHFNGASGNITAGKYNDGSKPNRPVLAARVEKGMEAAWHNTVKTRVTTGDLRWKYTKVKLPPGKNIVETDLRSRIASDTLKAPQKFLAAEKLAWYQRSKAGVKVNVSVLKLGNIHLLNLPGEIFVEYQLAAQAMKPGEQVCTAAYEEYGPGYIGTEISYKQGGYETSGIVSGVAPSSEKILMRAIRKVLK